MPLISDNWSKHFRWQGKGPMSTAGKKKLRQIVEKVHRASRRVRFWATPENTAVWNELYDAGVDLINTDDLDALQRFLLHRVRQGDQQLRGSQPEANSRCVELFSRLLPLTSRISRVSLLLVGWNVSTSYVLFGLAQGLLGSAVNTLWPRYYGLAHAGKIRGSVMTAIVASSALGPFVMGVSYDWFGSYTPSLGLFVGIFTLLLSAAPFATPPAPKVSAETAPPLPAYAS